MCDWVLTLIPTEYYYELFTIIYYSGSNSSLSSNDKTCKHRYYLNFQRTKKKIDVRRRK